MHRVYLSVAMGVLLLFPAQAQNTNAALSSPAATHKIQVNNPALRPKLLAHGARLVADYGSYQLYEITSRPGGVSANSSVEARDEYNSILLNAAQLDTSRPEVKALRKPAGNFEGKRMHLVHFAGPIQPAWRDSLLKTGALIVSYIPHNAYLVYGDSNAIAQIQSLAAAAPHIQWEGAFLDEYKIHPNAVAAGQDGKARQLGAELFAIQLMADDIANAFTLALLDRLKLEPLKRREPVLHYLDIVGRFAAADLKRIAAQPDVVSIQAYFTPRKVCERQDQIVAGNLSGGVPSGPGYLAWLAGKGFTQAQFTASGFVIDIADSGIDNGTIRPYHFGLHTGGEIDQASRVNYIRFVGAANPGSTLKGCDGHGTINAHIAGGYDDSSGFPFEDASGYHYGLGVCPFASLGSSVVFDPDNFTDPSYSTLVSGAYHNGARISNNSWGGGDGVYDIVAQEYDALVRDAEPAGAAFSAAGNQEMVLVFSAGNDGPNGQTINSPGTAKNVIAVGAADNVQLFGGSNDGSDGGGVTDADARDANEIPDFDSRGPCNDGRHKPDLVAPGTHVSGGVIQDARPGPDGSADACFFADASGVDGGVGTNGVFNPFYPDNQQFYTASSGSSHATPCVSGGCALLRQFFVNNGSTPPSPAMTKACLMNSARYLNGSGAGGNLWSDSQGMGELDLGVAFDGTPRILRDEVAADSFTASGQVRSFDGTIANANQPFKVTLAWSDAPGSTVSAAYNNDLDLTVTVGGVTYKGNVFSGAWSVAGGEADVKNNVESIFLPAGTSGGFQVNVTATSINSVGVPNNANALEQDFALVIYNAGSAAVAAPTITFPPSGFATNNASFRVTGTGIAGASVTIFDGNTAVGQGLVTAVGNFTITIKLSDGSHNLTATQVQNGTVSPQSSAVGVTMMLAPQITIQPQSLYAFLQETVTLSCGVMGAAPLRQSWLRNGVQIGGATTTNFTLPSVSGNSAGSYQFVASNAYGSVTSSVATITLGPNPFIRSADPYYGVFFQLPAQFQGSGLLTLNLTTLGAFSGTVLNTGTQYSFTGRFSFDGYATVTIHRAPPQTPIVMNLSVEEANDLINGIISDGNWSAQVQADRAVYTASRPCPEQGSYTVVLAGDGQPGNPAGDGYGKVTVTALGQVSFAGVLPDNSSVASAAAILSENQQWPLYVPLSGASGALFGSITVGPGPNIASIKGYPTWIKAKAEALYPTGFTNFMTLTGSIFSPATKQMPVLPLTNFILTVSGGDLPTGLSNQVALQASGKFVTTGAGIPKLTLSVSPTTGIVTGTFLDTAGKSTATIKGVVLQEFTNAAGFFVTPTASGLIQLNQQ